MKWFAVKFIYRIICGEGKHAPQFNEQIRLITAADISAAMQKAKHLAISYNTPFENYEGKSVEWNFVAIGGIEEIETPVDGAEVSSKILEPKSIEAYLKNLKHITKILTELNNKF